MNRAFQSFIMCIFTYTRIRLFTFVYVCALVSMYCTYNMWICNMLFIMLIYLATVWTALSLEWGKLPLEVAQNPLFLNIVISLEWSGQIFVIRLLICDVWWHVGPSPQRHLVMEHRASDWVKMPSKTLTAVVCHYNHVRILLSRMFLFKCKKNVTNISLIV